MKNMKWKILNRPTLIRSPDVKKMAEEIAETAAGSSDLTAHEENVISMVDVLQESQQLEAEATAVLGDSDDKFCTYPQVRLQTSGGEIGLPNSTTSTDMTDLTVTLQLRLIYQCWYISLSFTMFISGVSWGGGVHSVRLHPGWPQGGAKKWPKGASKRGRRKEEREEGEKEEKGRGRGKEKEKRKEKETKKRKGDIKWKERERKIIKVTNGKRFKRKKL